METGLLGDVATGLMIGAISVVLSISLAALIFAGDLSPDLSIGITLSLLSAALIGTVVAVTSSYPGTIALPHDRTAPILALMAADISAHMPGGSEETLTTILSAIAISAVATGLVLLLLGSLKWGRLIRFVPFSVVGGLLAGTGWLLVIGALGLMNGLPIGAGALRSLLEPDSLERWLPGAAFAIALATAHRRWNHYIVLPAFLIGGIALCHLTFWLAGVSPADAEARGWLLGTFSPTVSWRLAGIWTSTQTQWSVILAHWTGLAVVTLVAGLSILLNASAIELDTAKDVDLDRELESAGSANLLAGLCGGIVGFHSLSVSSLVVRMGRQSRLIGLVSAATCLFVLLCGTRWLSLFPKAIAGGLLMSLGVGFLLEWVVDARSTLPRGDYAVLLLILAVMATVGFLQGVAVGIAAAMVLFVLNYSRISVVKQVLSGAEYHSNVVRPLGHHRLLREKGDCTYILTLQGFVFFGTAHHLFDQVRARAFDAAVTPLRFVVLDFRRVSGLDSSAMLSFVKLKRLAEKEGFQLIFTQLSSVLEPQIEHEGFRRGAGAARTFADLDRGVEWCEHQILRAEPSSPSDETRTLREQLIPFWPSNGLLDSFLVRLEHRQLPVGHRLIAQGAASEELFFVESGQLSARLTLENGREIRLRTIGPGAVVGEMGLYLRMERSASVVTDAPSSVYSLSAAMLDSLQREAPQTAAAFHQFVAGLLAERLKHANDTLRVLLD